MTLWQQLKTILTYKEPPEKNVFEFINQDEPTSLPGQVGQPTGSQTPDKKSKLNGKKGGAEQAEDQPKQEEPTDSADQQKNGPAQGTKTDSRGEGEKAPSNKGKGKSPETEPDQEKPRKKRRGDCREMVKPIRASAWPRAKEATSGETLNDLQVAVDLEENLTRIKETFHYPDNRDMVVREFALGIHKRVKAAAVFIDGLTDKQLQNLTVFQPLMLLSNLEDESDSQNLENLVKDHLLPGNQVEIKAKFRDVVDSVLMGNTVVFIDRVDKAFLVETKGWEHRSVDRPIVETVVRGPQEGFTETLRSNTGLIRKGLKSEHLVTEMLKVGKHSRVDCAVMYLKGIANPQLVKEVKRRIESLDVDYIQDSGVLEQLIEDNPYGLAPQVLATERPDRVIAALTEGRVAIILDGNPFVLVVPVGVFGLLHTAEDAYLRWPYGSFLRIVRVTAAILSLLLPGFYLALINYHQEMLPTDLLLSIAGSRETVPFPGVIEVLIMEISFELIREASIRMPGPMGPTIGIVGALILGQAAVSAAIVSPIMIIVVAVTAIGSFVVPSYSLSFSLRILRFGYILMGFFMGFVGLSIGIFLQLAMMVRIKSMGMPYFVPFGPKTSISKDVILRYPIWQQENRPDFLNPLQVRRQPKISRVWIKGPNPREGGDQP